MQLLAYVKTRQQSAEQTGASQDGLAILGGSEAGEMTDFVRSNVSIYSVITDRIDQLQPNQQLTLKVFCSSTSLAMHFVDKPVSSAARVDVFENSI